TVTPPTTPTEQQITDIFTTILTTTNPISTDDNFFDLGGNSLQAAQVTSLVVQRLRTTVTLRQFYAAPTVLALGRLVDQAGGGVGAGGLAAAPSPDWSPVVPLQEVAGTQPPLFIVHAVSGSAYSYAALARQLGPDQSVYGLEAPGLEEDVVPLDRVVDLAERYVQAVRRTRPNGPYLLSGWSMGGLVAFEMARILTDAGARVDLVLLLDSPVPTGSEPPDTIGTMRQWAVDLAGIVGRPMPDLDFLHPGVDPDILLDELLDALTGAGLVPADVRDDLLRRYRVFSANVRANYRYLPDRVPPVPVHLINAVDSDQDRGWERFLPEVPTREVPGDHYTMWSTENLPVLAAEIRRELDAARARRGIGDAGH
ncbi:alpha/beta fold hydrolase, partial [Plantactinospora sp. B5E13]|uniref:thioesterase domain-containing protein n=1 Tax=unclassified Plantactinospora TaxID=2631981 RepID=UPI00325C3D4A